jgi:uncharacterized protein (DUF433 family)
MDWAAHIHADQEVLLGKPIIKGTRISVEHLIGRLADGWTEEDLLANYPRLTKADLQAVFSYLLDCMRDGLLFEGGGKQSA